MFCSKYRTRFQERIMLIHKLVEIHFLIVPREIDNTTLDIQDIGSTSVTFGPIKACTNCKVEPVAGILYRYHLATISPNSGVSYSGDTTSTSSFQVTNMQPATQYEFWFVNVNECGDISDQRVQQIVCTCKLFPKKYFSRK